MTTTFNTDFSFETKLEILDKLKISSSTLYRIIDEGLWPPPIPIGERAVRYASSETNLVIEAMIAGKTKEEIKLLVSSLVLKRQELSGGIA
jgi:prophage regulatory protein